MTSYWRLPAGWSHWNWCALGPLARVSINYPRLISSGSDIASKLMHISRTMPIICKRCFMLWLMAHMPHHEILGLAVNGHCPGLAAIYPVWLGHAESVRRVMHQGCVDYQDGIFDSKWQLCDCINKPSSAWWWCFVKRVVPFSQIYIHSERFRLER